MSEDWDKLVGKAQASCVACEAAFATDAVTHAALRVGDEGFERRDLCDPCFEKERDDAFSFWLVHRGGVEQPVPNRLDLSYLTELFKRLEGKDAEDPRKLAWIVTLLLLRKKVLVLEDRKVDEEGVETLVVREKRNEEKTYEIPDPRMDDEAIAAMSEDLGRVFNLDQKAAKAPKGAQEKKAAEARDPAPEEPKAGGDRADEKADPV